MNRRQYITTISASTISVSGCLSRLGPKGSTSTVTTAHRGTETPLRRLSIQSVVDSALNVNMKLVDLSTDVEAYNRTQTFNRGDKVSLDEHFTRGTDYQFVLSIDNDVRFDRPIYSYEGYALVIRSRDSVEIEEHAEV